jgi:hypothetical protein
MATYTKEADTMAGHEDASLKNPATIPPITPPTSNKIDSFPGTSRIP